MGKKTYVSSTVYNLAGDPSLRPNFLRSVVIGTVLSGNSKASIGSNVIYSAMSGTGAKQKSFFRWAQNNYDLGMPNANIDWLSSTDASAVLSGLRTALGVPTTTTVEVISSFIDTMDVDYWARLWIMNNQPSLADEDWSAEWDTPTSRIRLDISSDALTTSVQLPATEDFFWGMTKELFERRLLYIYYRTHATNESTGLLTKSEVKLYTYRMGSGNVVFDNSTSATTQKYDFFPPIPLRLDNKSISDSSLQSTYDAASKAYRKLTGRSIDDLLESIEDNESIADIDFCYLVSGVSASAKDNAAMLYIYEFFKDLIPYQKFTKQLYEDYRSNLMMSEKANALSWNRWLTNNSESDPLSTILAGGAAPAIPPSGITKVPTSSFRIWSSGAPNFDQSITWLSIDETIGVGNGKTFDGNLTRGKMAVGDLWFHVSKPLTTSGLGFFNQSTAEILKSYQLDGYNGNRVYLFHQTGKFSYRRLEIIGMEHINKVYNDKSVVTSLQDAVTDGDEESGFLVPMHYPSLKSLGIIKSAQLSYSNTYLVFNSYQVVKTKWYQSGIFKVFLVIASAVVSVVFPPAGVGLTAGGILGSNLAIGASLGLGTGLTAAIAGSVANAIAAMVLSTLVQMGATAIFGDKIGAVLGTILSTIAMKYAGNYAMNGNFDVDWSSMFKAENLMKLTDSVSGAYSAWTQASAMDIYDQISNLGDEYKSKLDAVKEKSSEMLGMTSSVIDPTMFTDASGYSWENNEEFVSRTTMTGDEIAELSQAMIYDFTELTLELPMGRV